MNKLQSYIGIGLLLIVIIGFIFMIVRGIVVSDAEIQSRADVLPNLSSDFLTDENEVTKRINELTVPAGVPVTVSDDSVGRTNVFTQY